MANNPKKVKDPTEVALSAIQEALNIADAPTANLEPERKPYSRSETPASDERAAPSFDLGAGNLGAGVQPAPGPGPRTICGFPSMAGGAAPEGPHQTG